MSTSRAPAPLVSLLLLALAPTPSLAQLDVVNKIFSKVTDVDAAYITGTPVGKKGILTDSGGGSLGSLRGLGIEVLFNLGSLWRRDSTSQNDSTVQKGDTVHTYGHMVSCETAGYDSTLTETEVRKGAQREVDSVYKITKRKPPAACDIVGAELGLGYSELRGFRGDTLSLQGSIVELPAVSAYFSLYPRIIPKIETTFYLGVRTGFMQLKDLRATVEDTVTIVAAGSSFQIGPTAGVSFGKSGLWSVFVEIAFTYRTIDGVTWTPAGTKIPAALQKPLRPSTRTLSLGGQISIASALAATP